MKFERNFTSIHTISHAVSITAKFGHITNLFNSGSDQINNCQPESHVLETGFPNVLLFVKAVHPKRKTYNRYRLFT
jgi:hypothetical protein